MDRLKILVVDDESRMRKLIKDFLVKNGFEVLEAKQNFLQNPVIEGSYGENWSLRKVLRRFIWHDRIHAKAMYRMVSKVFDTTKIKNPFCF